MRVRVARALCGAAAASLGRRSGPGQRDRDRPPSAVKPSAVKLATAPAVGGDRSPARDVACWRLSGGAGLGAARRAARVALEDAPGRLRPPGAR